MHAPLGKFLRFWELWSFATLLANNSQYCWMLHVASVCTPCCMLLGVVASACTPLPTGTQQLTTSFAQQCWELSRPFACSLTVVGKDFNLFHLIRNTDTLSHPDSSAVMSWKFRFVFDFRLYDLQLNVPELLHLAF